MGVGGFITPPDGWMKTFVEHRAQVRRRLHLATRCRRASGAPAARCGASSTRASQPDIMTMAKGIANGYPISAVLTTGAIADAWKGGNISTFGGNPISSRRGQRHDRRDRRGQARRERRGDGQGPPRGARGAQGEVPGHRRRARARPHAGRRAREGREGGRPHAGGRRDAAPLRGDEEAGLLIGRGGLTATCSASRRRSIVGKSEIEDALQDPRRVLRRARRAVDGRKDATTVSTVLGTRRAAGRARRDRARPTRSR